MSDDQIWKAVHRIEDAADRAARAADTMENAAQRIANMLEEGYGGNGVRLLELLEKLEVPT